MTSRSITGLFLAAALLAVPAAAHAQTKGTGIWLGGLFGLEAGKETGFQLRFDGEVPLAKLAPNISLSGVASGSFAALSHRRVYEAMPAGRLTWAATPTAGGYGDVGLGLAATDGNLGTAMRFLAGAYYEMNSYTRFVGEIGLHPHFGKYDDTTFTLLVGAKFKI